MARRSKFGRFQVENQASDPFKHTDVAYNLDQLDQMFGGPNQTPTFGVGDDFNNPTTSAPSGSSQWLYPQDPTTIVNFGNRTLYNIIRALDYNDVPLGAVFAWWRPSTAVPLPSGCVPADGSSYTGATQHSYVPFGITTITVPDLRNKMILGAYETATGAPTTALNRDGTAATLPSVDTATAGPGIRAIAGTNVPRNLAHTHTAGSFATPDHLHNLTDHLHIFAMIDHAHTFSASTGAVTPGDFINAGSGFGTAGNTNHRHSVSGLTAGISGGPPVGYTAGMPGPVATGPADRSLAIGGTSASALTTPTEILPRYVGLLWMVKIKKAGPLHNTAFPVGT